VWSESSAPFGSGRFISAPSRSKATRTAQDHANATYFGGRGDGDEWLDWSDTSRNLHNKVRGIARPGPGARTTVDGQSVVIWSAFYEPAWPAYLATPGQVVGRRHDGALVKTGDSVLLIREIQVGSAPPSAPRWKIGTRLGAGTPASRSAGERLATPQKESGRTRP
jgi:methionyl-tRNA formyltransferase